jgi:pyruvate formate-lyase activating enzyme-like uncharacterized protein
MKPKCRIKVTLKCNLSCPYCINGVEEYRKNWRDIKSLSEINFNDYRTVIVSGGEPLVSKDIFTILGATRGYFKGMIYLQTNGTLLTKSFVKDIDDFVDGIGLSIHSWFTFRHMFPRYMDILKIKPIRLYIQSLYSNSKIARDEYRFEDKGFTIKWWSDGDFDSTEHIYVLRE